MEVIRIDEYNLRGYFMNKDKLTRVLRKHCCFLIGAKGVGTMANLEGANLGFSSGVPFSCKGTYIKGDSRLFSQMVYHLTRQDWSACTKEERGFLADIPKEILNSFCKYRDDIEEV